MTTITTVVRCPRCGAKAVYVERDTTASVKCETCVYDDSWPLANVSLTTRGFDLTDWIQHATANPDWRGKERKRFERLIRSK